VWFYLRSCLMLNSLHYFFPLDSPTRFLPQMFELSVTCGITTLKPSPVPTPVPTSVPTFEFVTRLTLNATMRVEFASVSDFMYPNAHQVSA